MLISAILVTLAVSVFGFIVMKNNKKESNSKLSERAGGRGKTRKR